MNQTLVKDLNGLVFNTEAKLVKHNTVLKHEYLNTIAALFTEFPNFTVHVAILDKKIGLWMLL